MGKAKPKAAKEADCGQSAPSSSMPALARLHARAIEPPHSYVEPLNVVDLLPAQPGFLLLVDDFLSAGECARLIEAADAAGLQPSSEADRRPKKGEAFLDRESLAFVDSALTEALWSRLRPVLPDVVRGTGALAEPYGFHGDGRGRGGHGREGVRGQVSDATRTRRGRVEQAARG